MQTLKIIIDINVFLFFMMPLKIPSFCSFPQKVAVHNKNISNNSYLRNMKAKENCPRNIFWLTIIFLPLVLTDYLAVKLHMKGCFSNVIREGLHFALVM